jgi:hypothetical protein
VALQKCILHERRAQSSRVAKFVAAAGDGGVLKSLRFALFVGAEIILVCAEKRVIKEYFA